MRLKNKLLFLIAALVSLSPMKVSFNNQEELKVNKRVLKLDNQTLRIYNWEDYIYEDEESDDSMIKRFKEYYQEKYGVSINVIYDTFDTNETMFNQISLDKQYDLICPSDYMIQKMMAKDMLLPFDYTKMPNYENYISPYLKNVFVENNFYDYAVGYMWGTMGLIYNPNRVADEDMQSWENLWNNKYKNLVSIKDSMRDTYVVGIFHVFKEALDLAKRMLDENRIDANYYNSLIQSYFDKCDDDTLTKVENALKSLKKNIYGFEVDSGKNDIATGKIAINLAWSGDAVYAMDTAEEENDLELKYAVPNEGSNVWFDGWVMPKGANQDLAQEFLDFISTPEEAVLNMDYIGYTSFITGQEVLDYIKESYEYDGTDESYDKDLRFYFGDTITDSSEAIIRADASQKDRQFDTQFPDEAILNRCAMMKDFGDQNDAVVAMWTRVRSNEVNVTTYVILGVLIAGVLGYLGYSFYHKGISKRRRKARKKRAEQE